MLSSLQYLINPQIAWKADLTSSKTMSLPRQSLTSHDDHVAEDVPYTKWQLRKQKDAELDNNFSPLWLDIEGPRREGNETAAGRDILDSEEDANITLDPTVRLESLLANTKGDRRATFILHSVTYLYLFLSSTYIQLMVLSTVG